MSNTISKPTAKENIAPKISRETYIGRKNLLEDTDNLSVEKIFELSNSISSVSHSSEEQVSKLVTDNIKDFDALSNRRKFEAIEDILMFNSLRKKISTAPRRLIATRKQYVYEREIAFQRQALEASIDSDQLIRETFKGHYLEIKGNTTTYILDLFLRDRLSIEACLALSRLYGNTSSHALSENDLNKLARVMASEDSKEADSLSSSLKRKLKRVQDIIKISQYLEETPSKIELIDAHKPKSEIVRIASRAAKHLRTLEKMDQAALQEYLGENYARIPASIDSPQELLELVENNPQIKAISLDMVNTILHWTSSTEEKSKIKYAKAISIINDHLKSNNVSFNIDEYRNQLSIEWKDFSKTHHPDGKEFYFKDVVRKTINKLCSIKNITIDSTELDDISEKIVESDLNVTIDTAVADPDVLTVLEKIKGQGIKIGVLTNIHYSDEQVKRILRSVGLLKFADVVIGSADLGYRKSLDNPKAFQEMLKALGSKAEETLHTGDAMHADVEAAQKAGLISSQLKRHRKHSELKDYFRLDSPEGANARIQLTKDSLDSNAQRYIERTTPSEFLTPKVREHALRLYGMARELFGPVVSRFAQERVESLRKAPRKVVVCLGRDGLSAFLAITKLLSITGEHELKKRVKYVNISRIVKDKALQDAGFEYPPGYDPETLTAHIKDTTKKKEKIVKYSDKHKLVYPKEGDHGYLGYKDKLRKYLERKNFFDASEVEIIDNGVSGTTQTALMNLFPEVKISGHYLHLRRKINDACSSSKEGYLHECEEFHKPGHRTARQRTIKGDSVMQQNSTVYIIEDVFNGIFSSNARLLSDKNTDNTEKIIPKIIKMTRNDIVDPSKVPEELRPTEVYSLFKKIVLLGILDAVKLESRKKDLDPDGKLEIYEDAEYLKKRLADYMKDQYRAFGSENPSDRPDNEVLSVLVRERGYRNHAKIWTERWKEWDEEHPTPAYLSEKQRKKLQNTLT